jgi:thioredoxin 1
MASDNFINLVNAADFSELIKNDKVVTLFIYPPGQPCKNMAATAAKVAKDDSSALFIVVDIRVFPGLRKQYHVGGIPSLVLFRNGVELSRSTGQRDTSSLRAYMAKTFLGAGKAFMTSPVAYTAAWISGHFKTNPVCENQ